MPNTEFFGFFVELEQEVELQDLVKLVFGQIFSHHVPFVLESSQVTAG